MSSHDLARGAWENKYAHGQKHSARSPWQIPANFAPSWRSEANVTVNMDLFISSSAGRRVLWLPWKHPEEHLIGEFKSNLSFLSSEKPRFSPHKGEKEAGAWLLFLLSG